MQPSTAGVTGKRISSVADMLGIPVSTIRSWERRYGFPSPPRTGGRHRRYSSEEIAQLRAVRDRITRGERAHAAILAVRAAGPGPPGGTDVDAFVDVAERLDAGALRSMLDATAVAVGPERAICELALPGMRSLGARWRAGAVDVATEHAASEVVRGWLSALASAAPPPIRPSILLACGPGERHTIGLEAFGVLLARRGFATRLLGADTPERSLVTAARATGARAAVVTAHRSVMRRAAIASIVAIDRFGIVSLYGGNAFVTPRSRLGVPGRYLGDDLVAAVSVAEAAVC